MFQGIVDFDPGMGPFNLTYAGGYDVFISKLDSAGNFMWAKALGAARQDIGYSIALSYSGNVHVAGGYRSPSIVFGSTTLTNADTNGFYYDVFISKLDVTTGIESSENNKGTSVFPNPS